MAKLIALVLLAGFGAWGLWHLRNRRGALPMRASAAVRRRSLWLALIALGLALLAFLLTGYGLRLRQS